MARRKPDVELDARASAQEVRVLRTEGPWEISTVGRRRRRDTRRRNIPIEARHGQTYKRVEIELRQAVDVEDVRRS
jgi:hypothetical protein